MRDFFCLGWFISFSDIVMVPLPLMINGIALVVERIVTNDL